MNSYYRRFRFFSACAAALAAIVPSAPACSVCGCSLSSDWGTEGSTTGAGLVGDLTFQYYDQDNLREGTRSVDRTDFALPNEQELQIDTLTRSFDLHLAYVRPGWGLDFDIPEYDRFHSTIGPGDTAVSESRASGPGDARVSFHWQTYNPKRSLLLRVGFKLPTGRFNQNFDDGPEAGTLLDRGLQLGTGTTDVIAAASYFARPLIHLGWFAQATVQQALAERDGFIPSSTAGLNVGVRYLNSSAFTPQLQLNARWDSREHGIYADAPDSGDGVLYGSPGFTAQLDDRRSAFIFLQVPVAQRVNGLQLEPRWLVSAGLRWSFN
jgi:hypothetical protein